MKDLQPVTIVRLACEGGGAELLGARDKGGAWRFRMKGDSIALDEQDEEEWRDWETGAVATWAEALTLLPADWLCWSPMEIHPEFKELMRAAIEAALPSLREDFLEYCVSGVLPVWRRLGVVVEIPEKK